MINKYRNFWIKNKRMSKKQFLVELELLDFQIYSRYSNEATAIHNSDLNLAINDFTATISTNDKVYNLSFEDTIIKIKLYLTGWLETNVEEWLSLHE